MKYAALYAMWQSRNPRERLMLLALAVTIGFFGVYMLLVRPITMYHASAERNLEAAVYEAELVTQVLRSVQGLQTTTSQTAPLSGNEFPVVLRQSAKQANILLARVEVDAGGMANIWLEAVTPYALYSWLGELKREYGVSVAYATLSAKTGGSLIQAQLKLKAPQD